MSPVLSILSAWLLISTAPVTTQDTSLWRYTTTEKMEFYRVTPLGDLLVGTKDEVVVLDPETGEVQWTRSDIDWRKVQSFNAIPFKPYSVLRTKDGIVLIDMATGETLWDSTSVPLKKVRGHLPVPGHDLLLVYGEGQESKRTLVAVDVTTGEVRWQQDTLFRESPKVVDRSLAGHQPPLEDSDSTFILSISKDGPMRIHSRTGELLWRTNLDRDPPMLSEGYAPMLHHNGVLPVPYRKTYWNDYQKVDHKLIAFDMDDGSVIWDREDKFPGHLVRMEITGHGLVVVGYPGFRRGEQLPMDRPFIDLVDWETGLSIWERPFGDLSIDAPFVVDADGIFIAKREELVALDYEDGSSHQIAQFEFQGGEHPLRVQMASTGFLVSANQNLLSLDRTGEVQYHRYYEPPGRSWLENAAIMASEAFVAATAIDCMYRGGDSRDLRPAVLVAGSREWRALVFEACTGWSVENPDSVLPPSAEDAVNWVNYTYVYTKQPSSTGRDGFSLVKLDMRNGEEVARVWIDERHPDYVLDPINGFVFVKENDKEIFALKFPL